MKKVLISMMVVLSVFAFSTAALAEKMQVSIYSGEYEKETDWVYVNKGNTLHVGVSNAASETWQTLSFRVVDSNGKVVTQGATNDANDDKAYAIGVPVGNYKLELTCHTDGERPTCHATGWLND